MSEEHNPDLFSSLRQRAEKLLQRPVTPPDEVSVETFLRLLHELEVHQIELEMQNEELRTAQFELAVSRRRYVDLYDFAPVGYLTIDTAGIIQEANLTGAALLGVERNFLPRQPFSRFVFAADQDSYYLFLKKLLESQQPHACELRMVKKDGSFFHARLEGIVAENGEGKACQCRIMVSDITARKRAEEQLRYQAAVLEHVHDAIIASDKDYRLTIWNAAAETLYGWKAEEVLGQPGLDIVQTEFPELDKSEMLRMIAETGQWRGETTQTRKDRTRIPVEVSSIVFHDENGQISGYVSVNRDITARKRAEEALRESEERYRAISELTSDFAYSIGIEQDGTRTLEWIAGAIERITGYTVSEITARGDMLDMIYPDDRPRFQQHLQILLAGMPTIAEFRILTQSGLVRWVLAYGKPVWDETHQHVIRVYGAVQDTTERHQMETDRTERATELAAFNERQRLARELHDAVSQSLFSANIITDMMIRQWNQNPPTVLPNLKQLHQLTRGAQAEMRMLLLELRPTALAESPLEQLLNQLVTAAISRTGIEIALHLDIQRELPPDVHISLYRITQEALNNVIKHARANRANISLQADLEGVQLTIEDNGHGFDLLNSPPGHLGLKIMRERAHAINASLTIVSSPGQGTRIVVAWVDAEKGEGISDGA